MLDTRSGAVQAVLLAVDKKEGKGSDSLFNESTYSSSDRRAHQPPIRVSGVGLQLTRCWGSRVREWLANCACSRWHLLHSCQLGCWA